MTTSRLDSRAWLVWALAAMTPVMLGRNPWLLAELLVIVIVVRTVWQPANATQRMTWFIRIAAIMVVISVVFDVLTVHAGNRVIAHFPDSWPVVGGTLTWNALAYGVLGGIALFILVLIGITTASLVNWIDLFHVLPHRLSSVAVTGSVAWAFLPQTAVAWNQIREAQTMRGYRFRAVRDFVPIVVPLLAGGLERSLAMAEALEARGFGASTRHARSTPAWKSTVASVSMIIGMIGIALAAYSFAVSNVSLAIGAGIAALAAFAVMTRLSPDQGIARTRYRNARWTPSDTIVSIAALVAALAVVVFGIQSPGSLAFRVYPTFEFPETHIWLLLLMGLLMTPALVFAPEAES